MKISKKIISSLSEGVFALPFKTSAAKKLAKLMASPLKAKVATKKLGGIFGSDELFDYIDREEDPTTDVRKQVMKELKSTLKEFDEDPSAFKKPFEAEALKILKGIK